MTAWRIFDPDLYQAALVHQLVASDRNHHFSFRIGLHDQMKQSYDLVRSLHGILMAHEES